LWTGYLNKDGYGTVWAFGKMTKAHRAAWQVANGPIPKGVYVCHRCDMPACIEVDHLFLGTQKDNMADCKSKGRLSIRRGEESSAAKLTAQQASAIRDDRRPQRVIAAAYGISKGTVWGIKSGLRWISP